MGVVVGREGTTRPSIPPEPRNLRIKREYLWRSCRELTILLPDTAMSIELPENMIDDAVASIQRYSESSMEERMGSIAARALLDFFLEEIGPCIHNKAMKDVQGQLHARVLEIDVELHEEEFPYWLRRGHRK